MSQLTDDVQQNYDAFIEGIKATGKIWGLSSSEGWVVCESEEFEDSDVVPFWSDEADAKSHCCDEWADMEPKSVDIAAFVDEWLTGMAEDGLLIGPNWNAELDGLEVEPADLADRLLDGEITD